MSTEIRHSDTEAHAPTWWVRDHEGGRYGPVAFEVLKSWVRDGRIGPANEISRDGVEWSPATAEPALEMEWVVEVEDGQFYGPIHRDAVRGLINEGAIAQHAVLFRRTALDARDAEAECLRLAEALQQAQAHAQQQEELCHRTALDVREAKAECLRLAEALQQAQAHAQQQEELCRQAQQRAAEGEAERVSLSEMYAAWLKEAEALLAQTRAESEAALQQALADVADWTDRYRQAEADFERSRADAREWRTRLRAAEEACQTAQRERADWQAEAQRALAEVEELRRAADARPVSDTVIDVEVLPPERPDEARYSERPSEPSAAAGAFGERLNGLSLAELEWQAQRELERLGARGQALFAKNR